MKNIKAKIERVEKETKRIKAINELITYCEAKNLKPVATFVNGGSMGRFEDSVVIDKNIMIQILTEQKLTIELELEDDIKFITAIELLVSAPITSQKVDSNAPAPVMR